MSVEKILPGLKEKYKPDLVIAQSENVTHGKGMEPRHMHELQEIGIDFFTGGNHSIFRKSLYKYLEDASKPVIRPANFPKTTPGKGYKVISTAHGDVLIISLLGHTVPGGLSVNHPLEVVDDILKEFESVPLTARIVNFHGDYSSEKRMIGYFLDGRVTAVVGDHWHVPTADAMILPKGTAHITDVGMCGTVHSSLGVKLDVALTRWKDQIQTQNELEESHALQFNAIMIKVDSTTGLAKSIESINNYF